MTDTLPQAAQPDSGIQVIENTPIRYRAIHYPSGIKLYVTWDKHRSPAYGFDTSYSAILKQDSELSYEWLDKYGSYHPTKDSAIAALHQALAEILADN